MGNFLKEGESISGGKLHLMETYLATVNVVKENSEKVVKEAKEKGSKLVLRPRIGAIHAGRTRNNNIYPAEKLKGDRTFKDQQGNFKPTGVHSFTTPYPKPMLTNHDKWSDPTGRIKNAQFVKDSVTGRELIVIMPEITDQEAIQKVLDERYLTVSVGTSTDAAICNICGANLVEEGYCGHEKGQEYEGVTCGWILGNLWFDECSWVTVPADSDAQVIDKGEATTVEAYMESDRKIYDLSGAHGSAAITESVADTLGLVLGEKKPEGGSNTVTKPNENTATTETPDVIKDQKIVNLEERVSTLEGAVSGKDVEIASLQEQLLAKDTLISQKEEVVAQKDTQIETLTSEKTELAGKITNFETEKAELVNRIAEMSAKAHEELVERVVDLKISLKKPGVQNREDAILAYGERTHESLEDTYEDLMNEISGKGAQFVPEKVNTPDIVGAIDGEKGATIEGQEPSKEDLDAAKVLKLLFSGNYKKQK